jgi:hypothetical protein
MEIKEILAKIHKLQTLANGASAIGSIAEAEAATLAIARLLDKYNLSLFDMDNNKAGTGINIDIDFFGDIPARETWKQHLLTVLSEFNYCRAIINSNKHIQVVGTEANALVVIDLFNMLQSVYRYAAKQSKIRKPEISSFMFGCVAGLHARLEQEAQASVTHTTDLVRCYDVKIADFLAHYGIKTRKERNRKVDYDSFAAGYATGRNTPTRRTVQQKLF